MWSTAFRIIVFLILLGLLIYGIMRWMGYLKPDVWEQDSGKPNDTSMIKTFWGGDDSD